MVDNSGWMTSFTRGWSNPWGLALTEDKKCEDPTIDHYLSLPGEICKFVRWVASWLQGGIARRCSTLPSLELVIGIWISNEVNILCKSSAI